METHKNKQIITTIMVLAAVALVVGGIVIFNKKSTQKNLASADNTSSTRPANTTQPTNNSSTNASTNSSNGSSSDSGSGASSNASSSTGSSLGASGYKDGTYSVTADYYTPEDTDTIKVTLALKNGVVTNVSSTTTTSSRESRQYDSMFLNAYKSYVVGKSLSGLNLNRVSGASLTTDGFNNALDMIRQQAQA